MSEEKFIGYFRLVEACGQSGCPVCRCVTGDSRRYLDALLYEQVTDPDTRRAIRASWGFCNWHTWMLLEIEHSIFGSAIIYEDLLRLALKRTERRGHDTGRRRRWLSAVFGNRRHRIAVVDRYRERATCPACASVADGERRYLETLVTFIDDGDLQAAYVESDGLCLPHLVAALDTNRARPQTQALIDRTRARWAKVGAEIRSFVDKHDHRNREPYTEADATSSTRAFEMLVGARGVFGNDVHAAAARTAPRERTDR